MTGQLTFVSATNVYYPFSVAVSPDGNHLVATSPGIDTLSVYARDSATGAITSLMAKNATPDAPTMPAVTAPLTVVMPPR